MATITIEGRDVEVSDDFLSLSPDQQNSTVDEIAKSMKIQAGGDGNGIMGQFNAGVANTVGGMVDFVNPFDNSAWEDIAGGALHTGSAKTGLASGMQAVGADVATREPEGFVEGMARGSGNAAATIFPVVKGLQALGTTGGAVGAFANDAVKSLSSLPGFATEMVAGGIGGGAREVAEAKGAPKWVQDTVEMAAPAVALPGAIAAARGTVRGAGNLVAKTPIAGTGIRAAKGLTADIKRSLFPMTEGGANQVARERLQSVVGGTDRASELAGRIELDNELGLTPAQQTGDPNLLGLERAAANEDPLLLNRLTEAEASSRSAAGEAVSGMGGDVKDARNFFSTRLSEHKTAMQGKVDDALRAGEWSIDNAAPRGSETGNSARAVDRIRSELDVQLQQERALWGMVPKESTVPTSQTQAVVDSHVTQTPWAQRRDIPEDLKAAFGENGQFGEESTVAELYGLYSEMRRVSRSAMAGTDQNKNRARIANEVADAILKDLGTVPASKPIDDARAFSAALHDTFDKGATGRILKRTLDGSEVIAPDAALKRTIGRGGADAKVDAANIEKAAPGSGAEIEDYLRGRFADSVVNPSGEFTPKVAKTWFRNNRELLASYPDLRKELYGALSSREGADVFAAKTAARVKMVESQSAPERFNIGPDDKAILSIIGADDPAKTARSIVLTARKDPTGAAMAGVRASFTDYLIGNASKAGDLSGPQLTSMLNDPKMAKSLNIVFDKSEMRRLNYIASEIGKLDPKRVSDVGQLIDSPANRLIEVAVRFWAAKTGGQIGAGGGLGGSIQSANIATTTAQKALKNLTNERARELLKDAIEDPELFRALLSEPKGVQLPPEVKRKIAPYLLGAASNAGDE